MTKKSTKALKEGILARRDRIVSILIPTLAEHIQAEALELAALGDDGDDRLIDLVGWYAPVAVMDAYKDAERRGFLFYGTRYALVKSTCQRAVENALQNKTATPQMETCE